MAPLPRALVRLSRRQRFIVVCTLLLVCAFEVTMRLVPPDGMAETVNTVGLQSSTTAADFIQPRDTATITQVYTALNNSPVASPIGPFCNINGPVVTVTTTITFTWHGIPTQAWYQQNCSDWERVSGGLPDLWGRAPTVPLGI